MTFDKRIKNTGKLFVLSVLGVVLLAIGGMGLALYSAEILTFNQDVKSSELHSVAKDNPELSAYLEQEKDYEAHFITIANLVSQDKKQDITEAFILSSIPIVIISLLAGFFVARRLLNPVKQAYESQERFLQDAAHELRNPIAAINLALENATTSNLTPAKQKELIKMIGRQTRRLVRINEDLLFLEKRQPDNEITEINLSDLLADVIEGFQIVINKRGVKLDLNAQQNVTKKMRPNDFIKLSRNLIENAIKYSPEKSTIKIVLKQNGKVNFTVQDNGVGIPQKDLKKLGERFFRAGNTGKFEGSGLGLAIVYKIVNTYGGKIDISSQIHKGTKVNVEL